jgi:beta-glucosidase-like glycosyl hydrolase
MRHLSAFAVVAILATACARAPEPVPPVVPDPYAVLPPVDIERGSKITIDRLLELLTVRQKVGQLVMPWLLGNYAAFDSEEYDTLATWVDSLEVGGIIISVGAPLEIAAKLNALQRSSRLPLLVAADLEYGSGMRLRGGTAFPPPMAIAAGGRVTDAYELGRITADEARAVGIHMTFSPVADLNSNPENPIVNTRALGEDPQLAAPFLRAYVAGASDYGLFTTAKHFPGHGDTDADSHIALPVVRACWERLDSLELEPFRVAIRAGVTAVMTAHVAVPCVTDDRPEAATLSHRVMTELLRDSLGFEGLVVTDALDMGAIVRAFGPGESAVRAFLAGSDLLLMPEDPRAAIDAMVAAVDSGRISIPRLDRSVRRMLALKERAGLFDHPTVVLDSVPAVVGKRDYAEFAERVAQRSLTLVQEGPIGAFREQRGRTGVVIFARETNLSAGYDSARVLIDSNPRVIFAVNVRVVSGLGHVAMPDSLVALIEESAGQTPSLLVSFGNPYLLAQLPDYAGGYLLAWSGVGVAERAVAQALAGGAPVSGRLPITLAERFPQRWGIPLPRLTQGAAAMPTSTATVVRDSAFDYARLDSARLYLERQAGGGAFPGAVLVVGHGRSVAYATAVGRYGDDDSRPVSDTTVYDLASLTKVVGLTTATMLLVAEGRLELERPVVDYLPEFSGPGREGVLVRHLLTHTSGLPAWMPLYQETGTPAEAVDRALHAPLEAPITLTQVVERVSGMPIDRLLEERVFQPLSMARTRYRPPPDWTSFIAPTELDPWRGRVIRGEVHDENAGLGPGSVRRLDARRLARPPCGDRSRLPPSGHRATVHKAPARSRGKHARPRVGHAIRSRS